MLLFLLTRALIYTQVGVCILFIFSVHADIFVDIYSVVVELLFILRVLSLGGF